MLTRDMAKELISENILVNGVAPGVITTPFHAQFTPPDLREKPGAVYPYRAGGDAGGDGRDDLVLASPAADYLVGEIIGINGGQMMS